MSEKAGKYLLLIALILCVSVNYINAQSSIESFTNYAGSHGALLNPSSMTTSHVYADIGLNLNVSVSNNYFHVMSRDLLKSISDKSYKFSYQKTVSDLPRLFDVDFNYGKDKPASANVNIDALILSGMYNIKDKNAFGFFARARANVNVKNAPNGILEIGVVGHYHTYSVGDEVGIDTTVYYNQYAKNYSSKNANVGLMAWSELGFSYSRVVYDYDLSRVDLGGNAKLALATGALAMTIKNMDYHLELGEDGNINDSLWFIDNIKGGMAYSLPIGYDTPFAVGGKMNSKLFGNYVNGYGGGIDIGVTYTYKRTSYYERTISRSCQIKPIDYLFKVGFSIIDIGAVHFGKNNAEVSRIEAQNSVINTRGFDKVNTVHEFVNIINDSLKTKAEVKDFWMGLPTALSVQFDYSINKHFFVNAVVIQPVNVFKYHVTRDAQVLLAPRFESKYFDFSVPVTLLNYNRLLLGVSARFAYLTVGTQNLLNLIGVGDVYGLDFYVALKFNFNKGKCRNMHDSCWNSDFGAKKNRR